MKEIKGGNMSEEEVKELLLQYTNLVTRLRELGIIRSGRVVSDYGEYVVCNKLGLKRADSSVNKGYDAVDEGGLKYEIKSRKATAWNKPTLFPVKETQVKNSDFFIVIVFDNNWNIVKLLKIPTNELDPNVRRVHLSKGLVEKFSILNKLKE